MKLLSLLSAANIKAKNSRIESYNFNCETKQYHAYPGNIFEQVRLNRPMFSVYFALQFSKKSCNDNVEPEPSLPTLL